MARRDYTALNATVVYTMFSVFKAEPGALADRGAAATEAAEFLDSLEGKGVIVRGVYDLAGMRADADWMIWTHAESVEQLQHAYSALRRDTAEFNKSHVPAFVAGEEPGKYLCLYPFVRSVDWYLLPDEERRQMLADHGKAARGYADVRANTVPSFALGDYEWMLAFEGPELHRIVDLMRDLRATEARRHVREEVPFFTGPRVPVTELVAALP